VFAADIDNAPAAIALGHMMELELRHLFAAQPAADHDGQDGAIAPALEGGDVGGIDEVLGLTLAEPPRMVRVPCTLAPRTSRIPCAAVGSTRPA
jgi:hypothetical protein